MRQWTSGEGLLWLSEFHKEFELKALGLQVSQSCGHQLISHLSDRWLRRKLDSSPIDLTCSTAWFRVREESKSNEKFIFGTLFYCFNSVPHNDMTPWRQLLHDLPEDKGIWCFGVFEINHMDKCRMASGWFLAFVQILQILPETPLQTTSRVKWCGFRD